MGHRRAYSQVGISLNQILQILYLRVLKNVLKEVMLTGLKLHCKIPKILEFALRERCSYTPYLTQRDLFL